MFAFLILLFGIVSATAPEPRYSHSAVYLSNSQFLVVYGGETGGNSTNSGLSLDVSSSFKFDSANWKPLSFVSENGTITPQLSSHSAVAYQENGQDAMLLMFGFNTFTQQSSSAVYQFKQTKNALEFEWSTLNCQNSPSSRYEVAVTMLNATHAFAFGGVDGTDISVAVAFNSTLILDIPNAIWTELSIYSSPTGRWHHSASTLQDGRVVILGGTLDSATLVPMNQVWIFDPKTQNYTQATASGDIPAPRRKHSAVALGQNVYLYGGTDLIWTSFYNETFVLNTDTMVWTRLNYSNAAPAGRYAHTSTLVANQFLVAFGFEQDPSNFYGGIADNQIHGFDPKSSGWTVNFDPSGSNELNSQGNIGLIVGLSVGASFVIAAAVLAVSVRKRQLNKMKSNTVIQMQNFEQNFEPRQIIQVDNSLPEPSPVIVYGVQEQGPAVLPVSQAPIEHSRSFVETPSPYSDNYRFPVQTYPSPGEPSQNIYTNHYYYQEN